jgi:hypothetical protein
MQVEVVQHFQSADAWIGYFQRICNYLGSPAGSRNIKTSEIPSPKKAMGTQISFEEILTLSLS